MGPLMRVRMRMGLHEGVRICVAVTVAVTLFVGVGGVGAAGDRAILSTQLLCSLPLFACTDPEANVI